MDGSSLFELFDLYVFPAGRAAFAAERVAALADEASLPRVAAAANRAASTAREQHQIELRWQARDTLAEPAHDPGAMATNHALDGTLGAMARSAAELRDGLDPDDPLSQRAARFLLTALPGGVASITTGAFEEQLTAQKALLPRLQGELADDVQALGLTPFVERLATLHARFEQQLHVGHGSALTFDQVTAARQRTREDLAGLVATIVGEFPGRSQEHVEQRVALLAPIVAQNEALRRQRRRLHNPLDLDPDTGLLLEPEAPADAPTSPTPVREPEPVG